MTMTAPPCTPLEAALAYAALGIRVVPITPGHRYPKGIDKWPKVATSDPTVITRLWTNQYRGYGVGIVTGPDSGVWAIDVDVKEGKQGRESWTALLAANGSIPETTTAITPTGGRHFLFAWDDDHPVHNFQETAANQVAPFGPGIDIRGDGGFIVVAPTIHPKTDTPYLWKEGLEPWATAPKPAPPWMYDILHCHYQVAPAQERPSIPYTPPPTTNGAAPEDSAAAWLRAQHTWADVLTRDGWTEMHRRGDDTYWCRPGKHPRDGHSAVQHGADGPLVIFTTEVPPGLGTAGRPTSDGSGLSVSLFGYIAGTRYGGDRSACARDARMAIKALERPATGLTLPAPTTAPAAAPGDAQEAPGETPAETLALPVLADYEVNWGDLWTADDDKGEWACEPLIPAGSKVTHIYAPRAEGKSALNLYLAAALATGRPILDRPAGAPLRVAYIDAEMSRTELRDYLEEFGYGPDDDLTAFHYLVDAPIPYLDTVEGGLEVLRWVEGVAPDILFVDSITSVLRGEENDNGPYQQLFNFTIAPIKRLGIPSVWTGNSGKDKEKGSRGGSRKEDLMDCIWRMERGEDGLVKLVNTKRRASWIPERVALQRSTDGHGFVSYTLPTDDINDVPPGSMEVARLLDELGLPVDVGSRAAQKALREAGHGRQRAVVLGGLKYRRWAESKRATGLHEQASPLRKPGTTPGTTSGTTKREPREPLADDDF